MSDVERLHVSGTSIYVHPDSTSGTGTTQMPDEDLLCVVLREDYDGLKERGSQAEARIAELEALIAKVDGALRNSRLDQSGKLFAAQRFIHEAQEKADV